MVRTLFLQQALAAALVLGMACAKATVVTFEYSGFVDSVSGNRLSLLPYPVAVGDPFTLSYSFDPEAPDVDPTVGWGANSMSSMSVAWPSGTLTFVPVTRNAMQTVYRNDYSTSGCNLGYTDWFTAEGVSHAMTNDAYPNPSYYANMALGSCNSTPESTPWPGLDAYDKYLGAPDVSKFNWYKTFTFQVNLYNGESETVTGQLSAGGQVVPVPTSMWLFGSALGLMGWLRRTPLKSYGS